MISEHDLSQAVQPKRHERRAHERRRVLRGAVLTFNKGYGAFECRVRDQTFGGVRLVFGETTAVPNSFTLQISGESVRRTGRVRWRSPTELGVSLD